MKTCTKCGETKPLGAFAKNGTSLRSHCKPCVAVYGRLWLAANQARKAEKRRANYEANKTASAEQTRAWREANPERSRENDRAWEAANKARRLSERRARHAADPEKYAAICRAWYLANKDRSAANAKAWIAANPERAAAVSREATNRRRARKHAAPMDASATLETVAAIHGWLCYICGVACDATKPLHHPEKANLEHVIPLAKGGSHTFDNLRIACHRCNCIKGARFTAEQVREILNVAA